MVIPDLSKIRCCILVVVSAQNTVAAGARNGRAALLKKDTPDSVEVRYILLHDPVLQH